MLTCSECWYFKCLIFQVFILSHSEDEWGDVKPFGVNHKSLEVLRISAEISNMVCYLRFQEAWIENEILFSL